MTKSTQYGFTWGPLTVERVASDQRGGYYLRVFTKYGEVFVRATSSGRKLEIGEVHRGGERLTK